MTDSLEDIVKQILGHVSSVQELCAKLMPNNEASGLKKRLLGQFDGPSQKETSTTSDHKPKKPKISFGTNLKVTANRSTDTQPLEKPTLL